MHPSNVKQEGRSEELPAGEAAGLDDDKETDSQRRLADSLSAKSRKLKLDRRVDDSDRRTGGSSDYKGPARRKILDRRESFDDRRDKD
jgi:hypothetical protein